MRHWHLRSLIFIFLALGLIACNDEDPTQEDSVGYSKEDLLQNGPYDIGFRRSTVRYIAPGEPDERALSTYIWYPGQADDSARRSDLKLAGFYGIRASQSFDNIPLVNHDVFPVAIYSHGSGGEASLAYPFAERLASRGWVVVAMSHTDNTTLDRLSGDTRTLLEISALRPLDVEAVIDRAAAGFGLDDLEGRLDTDNVFLFGHSFGGFTSLVVGGAGYMLHEVQSSVCEDNTSPACEFFSNPDVVDRVSKGFHDPRVKAIGLQAPAPLGILDMTQVAVPTLMLSGDLDITTPDPTSAEPIWAELSNPYDRWLRFPFAGHYSFITICSDMDPTVIAQIVDGAAEDGCSENFSSPVDVVALNAAMLTAFAEKHILGVDAWDAILDGVDFLDLPAEEGLRRLQHTP